MSTTTYIALKNKLTAFANAHFQIKRIGFDYDEQSEDFYIASDSFPAVFVTLTNVSSAENVARFTVNIECLDLITQNRSNINFITSDCELILRDFHIYFRDGNETSIDVINEPTTTPLNNVKLDYCAGAEMSIEFEVDTYTVCAIPMGEIPEPTDNCEPVEIYENDILVDTVESGGEYRYETSCEDVTYTVKYEDNTIIEQGSEPSGGSILVVVPNCPAPEPCDDGTVNVQKSDATLISAVTVASGGTSNYQVSDSPVNVNASLLANVKATDTLNISVVDSTDTAVSVTLSGGNKITIPSLPCAVATPLRSSEPFKTGQTTSYNANDDGDLELGNGVDFYTLSQNNPFGNTNRFTDILGGQTYADIYVIDWATVDYVNEKVFVWNKNLLSTQVWATQMDNCALDPTSGAYPTGWAAPNKIVTIMALDSNGGGMPTMFASRTTNFWTSTTNAGTAAGALRAIATSGSVESQAKTSSNAGRQVRLFTFTELGL
jgi:VCBS repeat-containing protein